jgi:hypothetical protein
MRKKILPDGTGKVQNMLCGRGRGVWEESRSEQLNEAAPNVVKRRCGRPS